VEQDKLLCVVRDASDTMAAVVIAEHDELRRATLAVHAKMQDARVEARQARAAAIRAADDAGIDRALIAEAAGLTWPMSRQRWSQLRNG